MGEIRGLQRRRSTKARSRVARIVAAAALLLAASGLSTVAVTTLTAQPAAAAPSGCGYADSSANNGDFASTICWFDFTSFDQTLARTVAGQSMSVTLDGGYVANFTVNLTDVAGTLSMSVERRSTPLETRFAFGTDAYRGVPGLDTLYSLPTPSGLKGGVITFSNIQIVDSLGAPVTGFSFVAADTEDNVLGESFAWTSDKPINEIERLAPNGNWGCKTPIGLGTTSVTCAGTGAGGTTIAGGKSTALLVAADSPTTFATQWETAARSGIAIGIQTAKLTLVKTVASRIDPADSFDLSVTNSGGSVLGTATTGTTNSATTGAITALTGGSFTLGESATTGSPTVLSNYDSSWNCTNADPTSTTTLPSGSGTGQVVTPANGDDITCTVTNTAKAVGLTLVKSASTAGAGVAGDHVTYSFVVTNVGDLTLSGVHVDDSAFSGTGALGAITCPVTTLTPLAQTICTADYVLTQADVDAGTLTNTATAAGNPPGSTVVVSSVSSSTTFTPVQTAALTLVTSASASTAAEGDMLTYSYAVTNSGSVTVSDVAITETAFSGTGALSMISCPTGAFAPGVTVTCTASYVVTAADVTAGRLTNTATASATAPRGLTDPTSAASTATVNTDPDLAFTGVAIGAGLGMAGACLVAGLVIVFVRRRVALLGATAGGHNRLNG